jgi:hypothetical protein
VGYEPKTVIAMEKSICRPLDFILGYIDLSSWSNAVADVPWIFQQVPGMKMVLAMPPVVTGDTLANAASGADDHYYLEIAKGAAAVDRKMVIRVGWEFNGNWSPYYATPNPAEFIAAYRRVVRVFRSVSPTFKFEWCASFGADDPDSAYPGDDVVDFIATDIYEDSSWLTGTAAERWNILLTGSAGLGWLQQFAAEHQKPIAVPEYATNYNDGAFPTEMADWIKNNHVIYHAWWESREAFDGYLPDHPKAEKSYSAAWSWCYPNGLLREQTPMSEEF